METIKLFAFVTIVVVGTIVVADIAEVTIGAGSSVYGGIIALFCDMYWQQRRVLKIIRENLEEMQQILGKDDI